jgi:pimeloyl-ACP methyl ester carboxylesterase
MLAEKVATEMTDSALRDATLTTVERAGHAVMVDNGPGLQSAIHTFLAARGL